MSSQNKHPTVKGQGLACVGGLFTKRHNGGNRCNSASNSGKPQKAHSKTESRTTSEDQQHKTEAHEQGPKQLKMARSTQCALGQRKQSNTQRPIALSASSCGHGIQFTTFRQQLTVRLGCNRQLETPCLKRTKSFESLRPESHPPHLA